MAITPRGMSIQEAYRLFREGHLLVNRKYQRKLVWSVAEKQELIGSILCEYPIPLFLFASRPDVHPAGHYEIIDGMQRLNAIFGFIENAFATADGKYFDVKEFTRAKQLADSKAFTPAAADAPRLPPADCARVLDYQLAVTVYPTSDDAEITDVFGRINSGGRRLSNQERRQAGVATAFSEMVRTLGCDIRGDVSKNVLLLSDMPAISVESGPTQGYGVRAEDTFWCRQGIITASQLRASEDEEIIADIAASILLNVPLRASREVYDELYDPSTESAQSIAKALASAPPANLRHFIRSTFSVLQEIIEAATKDRNALRKIVNPSSTNPIKNAFYAVFMAFYDLIVVQERTPDNPQGIMESLRDLSGKLTVSPRYPKPEDRKSNINLTKGLIEAHFVKKEPPVLGHGPGLAIEFENSLRRSKIETARYEFKQGLATLGEKRELDSGVLERIPDMMCAIANVGPDAPGFFYIGVANAAKDAERIRALDGIEPVEVAGIFVVGIDRELKVLGVKLEQYVEKVVGAIKASPLSDPLKTHVLANVDTVSYRGLSVIRIRIPPQQAVSFVGEEAFVRTNSSTERIKSGPRLLALAKLFDKK
jgi:hypothetical protein